MAKPFDPEQQMIEAQRSVEKLRESHAELLEACKAMLAHLTDSQSRTHVDIDARLAVLDNMASAVRKAEGGSRA